MKILLIGSIALAIAASGQAATLTYFPTEQTGGDAVNLRVTFDDSTGDIVGTVDVLPDASNTNIGDIRALYFNLTGTTLTAAQVGGAISGSDVTAVSPVSSLHPSTNVNPLGPFDVGIEFGSPGIGTDDFQSTTFTINNAMLTPDLALSNFGSVAVRVTSIGAPGGSRDGSGKFLDLTGEGGGGGGGGEIPEPASLLLLGTGMTVVALFRRRRRAA